MTVVITAEKFAFKAKKEPHTKILKSKNIFRFSHFKIF